MELERHSKFEEADEQINKELDKRADLLMEHSGINKAVDAIVQHKVLSSKLRKDIPLTEEDLNFLQLDPETKNAYLELQNESKRTPKEILLEHLQQKNAQLESTNKNENEITLAEEVELKSQKLLKSFVDTEQSWLNMAQFRTYKREYIDKLILNIARVFQSYDDRYIRLMKLQEKFKNANLVVITANNHFKDTLFPKIIDIIIDTNNSHVIHDLDRVIEVVQSHNLENI